MFPGEAVWPTNGNNNIYHQLKGNRYETVPLKCIFF